MERDLFRPEALMAIRTAGFGEAVFYQPLSLRLLSGALAVAFLCFLAFISLAGITQTERVRGHLTGTGGEVKLYSSRAGVVSAVYVSEGQLVNAGDVMATVADPQFDEKGNHASEGLLQELETQMQHIRHRKAVLKNRFRLNEEQFHQRLLGLQAELELRHEEQTLLDRRLDLAARDYRAGQHLYQAGAISSHEYHQVASAFYSLQQQGKSAARAIESHGLVMTELVQQIEVQPLQYEEDILLLDHSLSQLVARRHELRAQGVFSITAPRDGLVSNMVLRIGDYVDPRMPVLTLLRPSDELEAWLYLTSSALARVAVGTRVMLSYDAYPTQIWGSFHAHISSVSESVMDPREFMFPLDLREPVYLVKAMLTEQTLDERGSMAVGERLRPGMQFSADIVTGRQTILQKLLSPLRGLGQKL